MTPAWLLLLALLARADAGAPGGGIEARVSAAAEEDEDYWYFDIYRPFFAEKAGPDGAPLMTAQRRRAHSRDFAKAKPAGTLRVFVIGGSVAAEWTVTRVEGAPQGRGRAAATLEEIFSGLFPGRKVEVINCGMGSYDSYRESLVLEEILGYDPDLVIRLNANNDTAPAAGPPRLKGLAALKLRRLIGRRTWSAAGGEGPAARRRADGGLQERTLRAMARSAGKRGVPFVLCTYPYRLGLPPAAPLPLGDARFAAAWSSFGRGDYRAAAEGFRLYAASRPDDPLGPIFAGRALERLGDKAGARSSYRAVAALDAACNDMIRRLAREEGAILADIEAAFEAAAPGARNDGQLFDDVHWYRYCDPLASVTAAGAVARDARRSLPAALSREADAAWVERRAAGWAGLAGRSQAPDKGLFWDRALLAVWESLLDGPGFSERSVALFEGLIGDFPDESAGLDRRRRDFVQAVRENVWTRSRSGHPERRWSAGLGCLGEAYRRAGRHVDAKRCFTEALRLDPSAVGTLVGLALTHAALGEKDAARARLALLREPAASFSLVRHYRGVIAPGEGGKAGAPGRAAPEAPCVVGQGGFWAREAQSAVRRGDLKAASSLLRTAQGCGSGAADKRLMAGLLLEVGDPAAARRVLESASRQAMPDAGCAVDLAEFARRTGQRRTGLRLLELAEGAGPSEGDRARIASAYRDFGAYERALRRSEELVAQSPDQPGLRVGLAHALALKGDREKAKAELARAQALGLDANGLRQAAQAWRALGDPGGLRGALARLREAAPDDAGVLVESAELERALGDARGAIALLDRAAGLAPTDEQLHRIGLLYGELGEPGRCAQTLAGLAGRHPEVAVYWSDKGVCEFASGAADGAVADLEKAIELDGALWPAHLTLGAIYAGRERYGDALRVYDRALSAGSRGGRPDLRESIRKARAELLEKGGRGGRP
ncbi:MAG: tetratricopeptide repeat protein [Elusimicrobia bacterium]|nr:tetratricopeptide repeat protein [Elusimicrobiota bacterium]